MTPERWNEINEAIHSITFLRNPKDMLSALYLLHIYYDEIMNGGFGQYFTNMEEGEDFHDRTALVTALKTVGMDEYIEITEKAIALYEKCENFDFDDDESDEEPDVELDELSFEFDDNAFIEKLYGIADKLI
jgi:hypothetical protein